MAYQALKLSSNMPFGKHRNEQIEDLICDHPTYIAWLVNEDVAVFDDEVIKRLEDKKII